MSPHPGFQMHELGPWATWDRPTLYLRPSLKLGLPHHLLFDDQPQGLGGRRFEEHQLPLSECVSKRVLETTKLPKKPEIP